MIIKSERNDIGYINEITKYLDEYLINKTESYFNYIEDNFENESFDISFTASIKVSDITTGTLHIEKGIVKSIDIFDRTVYNERVLDMIDQFIEGYIDLPLADFEIKCIKTTLVCCEEFKFKPDMTYKEPYVFKKGDIVKFEISDVGVRFEYEHNLYSAPIPPSSIYKYFK